MNFVNKIISNNNGDNDDDFGFFSLLGGHKNYENKKNTYYK